MASTNFKLFDENKTNMMSDIEYNINTQRLNGVQAGIASSRLQNKTLYQTSLVAYSLAQIMMQNGYYANDSAAVSAFVGNMSNSLLQKVLDKATSVEAQNGVNNTKWMTPALTKAAIDILAAKSQNILSDSTKTLYGLGSSAVPDDVLAELGKYKQYWWKMRTNDSSWYPVYGATSTVTVCSSRDELMVKFRYADEIEISDSGVVSLKNPVEVNSPYSNYTELNQHKFFQTGVYPGQDYNSNVYYVPEGAADATRNYSDRTYYVYKTAGVVTSEYSQSIGDWQFIQSSNRNAYPDSGKQDGYEYEYLGIPFDNAVTAPKIKTGSYVGTGTYGPSNPNTLTFGFSPKFVFVTFGGVSSAYFLWVQGCNRTTGEFYDDLNVVVVSGNTLSWYNTKDASTQRNIKGVTYYYIAIG